MDEQKIMVILVDDHPVVLEGISLCLMTASDISVTGTANGESGLLALLKTQVPDIILMDIGLPGTSGIEIARNLGATYPQTGIIMLTANEDEVSIRESIRAGARGYLLKSVKPDELAEAIRKVYHGEAFVSSHAAQVIAKHFFQAVKNGSSENQEQKVNLSDREVEIIRMICDGLGYKEIGEKLFISPRTVETHKNNILQKLGLDSVTALIRYAIRSGIVKA